ncbi:predicted protein [Lichtheimia corymbifera JMRC:FSU:9682]|uniref:HIT domain-containing protein n=1 Tax=Lichtheimia corymbifera JMRC:FSU:9682 TaxID=1263082 RepID=A0A068S9S4_9FUNG|nr:predicted protein [Lichtheimia corymbifera JMRC:FSU:9682]
MHVSKTTRPRLINKNRSIYLTTGVLQIQVLHWSRQPETHYTVGSTHTRIPFAHHHHSLSCNSGHVLVVSRRNVPRVKDLNPEEIADIMMSAQTIGNVVEKQFGCTSLTTVIQDGPQAGQTVPHNWEAGARCE